MCSVVLVAAARWFVFCGLLLSCCRSDPVGSCLAILPLVHQGLPGASVVLALVVSLTFAGLVGPFVVCYCSVGGAVSFVLERAFWVSCCNLHGYSLSTTASFRRTAFAPHISKEGIGIERHDVAQFHVQLYPHESVWGSQTLSDHTLHTSKQCQQSPHALPAPATCSTSRGHMVVFTGYDVFSRHELTLMLVLPYTLRCT